MMESCRHNMIHITASTTREAPYLKCSKCGVEIEVSDAIPIHRTTEGPIETFQGKMKPTTPASDAD